MPTPHEVRLRTHSSWVSGFTPLHVGVCLHALWSVIVLSIAVIISTCSTMCLQTWRTGVLSSRMSEGFHRFAVHNLHPSTTCTRPKTCTRPTLAPFQNLRPSKTCPSQTCTRPKIRTFHSQEAEPLPPRHQPGHDRQDHNWWFAIRAQVRHKSVGAARGGGLLDAPSINPITVIFIRFLS